MSAPTATDLALAIKGLQSAADELRQAAESVTDGINRAVAEVEEAAGQFDLEEFVEDHDAHQLADLVSRLHYDTHEGVLRFCSFEACRTAHEIGTGVVA